MNDAQCEIDLIRRASFYSQRTLLPFAPVKDARLARAFAHPPSAGRRAAGMSRDVEFTTLVREGDESSSGLGSSPSAEPRDERDVAYWSCFALGAGLLFPWNAYISAVDYFGSLYPHEHVDRAFGVLYFLPNLASLCVVLRFGDRVEPRTRIRAGYAAFLLCLAVPATSTSLAPTYVAVALTGVADAVCQGSLFGVVAPMPERFTQALMGGTSFSGLVVSTLRVISKAAFAGSDDGLRNGAAAYFAVSALWVGACLAIYARLERTNVFRHHRRKLFYAREKAFAATRESFDRAREGGGSEEDETPDETPREVREASPTRVSMSGVGDVSGGVSGGDASGDRTSSYLVTDVRSNAGHDASSLRTRRSSDVVGIVKKIWPHASTVFSVYAVTLSIFPGVLAEDVRNDTLGDWYAVLLILCFNAFDVVGKMVPSWWPSGFEVLAKRPRTVAAAAAARLFFVPAFLAVSKTRVSFASQTRLADSPAACVVLVAALGLTNGWYSSVGMMCAPKAVASHDAETCGTVMVLFLLAGLATGAACGWLWV